MTWQVAEGLKGRGHDVTLVAKVGSQFSGALVEVDANGYQGEALLARDAMRLHRSYPFDVFLDNGHLHELARLFPQLPVVNVYHDVYQDYARCAVLLSHGQQAAMPPAFEQARIIPNALNPDAFVPLYEHYENPFVLFMGALSEIKQPLLAIEACAYMGLNLVLAGGGIIGRFPSGGRENVDVVGAVSGATKRSLLRNARVFLQLGLMESFGLTTLEAGLSGTPVVGYPTGGTSDIIKYGANGVFVPMGGNMVKAVADAIDRAWDMNREHVRATTASICDVDQQITRYEIALANAMEGKWW
jgi:glycosyltransferase involved in cell wall biosynthesis